ncbi:unnamed protein product [Lota lota]
MRGSDPRFYAMEPCGESRAQRGGVRRKLYHSVESEALPIRTAKTIDGMPRWHMLDLSPKSVTGRLDSGGV